MPALIFRCWRVMLTARADFAGDYNQLRVAMPSCAQCCQKMLVGDVGEVWCRSWWYLQKRGGWVDVSDVVTLALPKVRKWSEGLATGTIRHLICEGTPVDVSGWAQKMLGPLGRTAMGSRVRVRPLRSGLSGLENAGMGDVLKSKVRIRPKYRGSFRRWTGRGMTRHYSRSGPSRE